MKSGGSTSGGSPPACLFSAAVVSLPLAMKGSLQLLLDSLVRLRDAGVTQVEVSDSGIKLSFSGRSASSLSAALLAKASQSKDRTPHEVAESRPATRPRTSDEMALAHLD